MFLACQSDNLRLLKFALDEWEQDVNPKGPILDSNTSRTEPNFLHCLPLVAAEANAELCICYLHIQGFDMEVRGHGGKTPLHIAAKAGHLAVMSALVGFSVSLTAPDKINRTALVAAMGNTGGQHFVRGLLASKPDRDDQLRYLMFSASAAGCIYYKGLSRLASRNVERHSKSGKYLISSSMKGQISSTASMTIWI